MKNKDKKLNSFFTPGEVAKRLGISRTAVHKRIKKGQLPSTKEGRNYYVLKDFIYKKNITTEKDKEIIERGVKKVVQEYKEALKMLGNE